MNGMAQSTGYRERNSTADRALNILQMFSEARPELSAIEVSEALGAARSTAYRYLQTLVQAGFLTDTGRGSFRLGLRVLELARIARRGLGLSEVCVPTMKELAERFNQTVLLTRLMGDAVICLEREEARDQYVRLSYERGSVLNINAGASALVLLAWLPEPEVRSLLSRTALKQFTPTTMVNPDDIVERLRQIHDQGYAISMGEVDPTAVGIAAPLFDSHGNVVAALSVVLIRSLVSDEELATIVDAVVEAAASLSAQLSSLDI